MQISWQVPLQLPVCLPCPGTSKAGQLDRGKLHFRKGLGSGELSNLFAFNGLF